MQWQQIASEMKFKKMVTSGGGLGLKFFKIILFQYGTTSEME